PGAAALQAAPLADGTPLWHLLARELAACNARVGGGVVGAVVGATRPEVVDEARRLLPHAPLLLPGVGAQGGSVDSLAAPGTDAPTSLVAVARSLLPSARSTIEEFRFAVDRGATLAAGSLARVGARSSVG
ncbi:MAG: orotidine 5-phosphate decarboxylase, partial [Thermoleophilia bacterium]|nr:orotidine 5-phosphate decarboxylase [Thermoleophilia bacterium]